MTKRAKQPSGDDGEVREPWALRNGGAIVIVGGALTVLIGLASVFWLPTIDRIVGEFAAGDLQRARADIRSSGLKLATGVGAATAGLLAWGRLDLSRQQHRLDEQSKRDERFARSVELLGSDNRSVRLGALYALEALAKDGYAKQTIYDVITAFARSSPTDRFDLTLDGQAAGELVDDGQGGVLPELETDSPTAEDFEAAITICFRCPEAVRLDLRGIAISGRKLANLSAADFAGSQFVDCRFEEGVLSGVSFVGATIVRSRFTSTSIHDCLFDGATLTKCTLRGVNVVGTLLASAGFVECEFRDVEFDHTSSAPVAEGVNAAAGQRWPRRADLGTVES